LKRLYLIAIICVCIVVSLVVVGAIILSDLGGDEQPSLDDGDSPFSTPDKTEEPSVTPSFFTITGNAILPDLSIRYENGLPGAGLYAVYLTDLSFNILANDTDPSFSFSVEPNKAYVLIAYYYGGQAIAAVTPTVTSDIVQDITIDTEVAMNLIMATEQPDDLEPTSLSRPLDDLLADANQEVAYLNAFYDDRNNNRNADRVADAVHAITMHQLNIGSGVSFEGGELDYVFIRSFGGGLEGIRPLSEMLNEPRLPLNPHFTFTRYNSQEKVDFGMSDLETKRWDYLGEGLSPHITPGGTSLIWLGKTSELNEAQDGYVLGVYKRVLGHTEAPVLLTPANLECFQPQFSPDETKIVFSGRYTAHQPWNLFVMNSDGSNLKQITNYFYDEENLSVTFMDIMGAQSPSWSPDCSEIIFDLTFFEVDENGIVVDLKYGLEIINSDGTNQRTFIDGLGAGLSNMGGGSWSPDGSQIIFVAKDVPLSLSGEQEDADTEIFVVSTDPEDRTAYYFTKNEFEDWGPSFSFDGRFIIFTSNREGEKGTLPGGRAI